MHDSPQRSQKFKKICFTLCPTKRFPSCGGIGQSWVQKSPFIMLVLVFIKRTRLVCVFCASPQLMGQLQLTVELGSSVKVETCFSNFCQILIFKSCLCYYICFPFRPIKVLKDSFSPTCEALIISWLRKFSFSRGESVDDEFHHVSLQSQRLSIIRHCNCNS